MASQEMSQQANHAGKYTATSAHFRAVLRDGQTDLRQYLRLINNCDEHDPLLSETPLGRRLAARALESLGPAELSQLQLALNVEQLIPTAGGLPRDYRGLAELMGFSSLELESRFMRSHNPAKSLLDAHVLQSRLRAQQQAAATCSLNHLLKMLESIERFDIIDDLLPQLVEWAASVHVTPAGHGNQVVAAPEVRITTPPGGNHVGTMPAGELYDAFVCFAPEDFRYAQELIRLLEAHNRRLVTVDNLLPGRFEYDAIVQMIASECRKVIVILTPNYLQSKDCDFQTKFANELAIKSGWNPRLIPVLCEPLDDARLPYLLRFMSKIDMTPRLGNQPAWQLKKLLFALDHDHNHASSSGSGQVAGEASGPASFANYPAARGQQPELTGGDEARSRAVASPVNYYDQDSREPIVDLAYSQTGTASTANLTPSGLSLMTSASTRVSTPSGWTSVSGPSHAFLDGNQASPATASRNPLSWYRSFKQRVRNGFRSAGGESAGSSPEQGSLSSRAILLPPGDSDENLSSSSGQATAARHNERANSSRR